MTPLPGSQRHPLPHARITGAPSPGEIIEVIIEVRSRCAETKATHIKSISAMSPASRLRVLDRETFAQRYGADLGDVNRVQEYVGRFGLQVVRIDIGTCLLTVSGKASGFCQAFGTMLEHYATAKLVYRGRTGSLSVPTELREIITGIFGLDNRPVARPHFQLTNAPASAARLAQDGTFTVPELTRLYNFPTNLNGHGECIALIEFNCPQQNGIQQSEQTWGAGFTNTDLSSFFSSLSLPMPSVLSVPVLTGGNRPGILREIDAAVTLDIEIAGAAAPGARIAVYFAPNTTAGFLTALKTAIHDSVNRPSVISISWGAPEDGVEWTPNVLKQFDQALQDAALLGITICCSSAGAAFAKYLHGAAVQQEQHGVDFPASSPFVLACGAPSAPSSRRTVSSVFAKPKYQQAHAHHEGRSTPDISTDVIPMANYHVFFDGHQGRTSGSAGAVAPFWSALIALLNQGTGSSIGFLNPFLYENQTSDILHDVSSHTDSDETPSRWNPTTGLGSPDGVKMLAALGGSSPSHTIRRETTSNDVDDDEIPQVNSISGLTRLIQKSW